MADARGFEAQIKSEFKASMDQWNLIIRKIGLLALQKLVLKTPVGNPALWQSSPPAGYVGGRARANWFVEIGGAGIEVTSDVDASGGVSISRGNSVIGSYRARDDFPVISLYNNLPYIQKLEGGHSTQAPAGMLAVTVTELELSV